MGYRSEVAIKCESKAYDRFAKVFTQKEMWIKPDKILHDIENDDYVIYWDWIKWYEDFEGVSAIQNVMSELDEEHDGDADDQLGYRFMRLGEDDSDIETQENTYDLELYMIRKIDIPEDWTEVTFDESVEV